MTSEQRMAQALRAAAKQPNEQNTIRISTNLAIEIADMLDPPTPEAPTRHATIHTRREAPP